MIKRTAAYALLLLFVITGLASPVSKSGLKGKERRFLISELKNTRSQFLESIKGLSAEQLAFKPAPDKWSVDECIRHIALAESGLWTWASSVLKQPLNAEMRSQIKVTDQQLIAMVADRTQKAQAPETLNPATAKWTNITEATNDFKVRRDSITKYVRSTADDMRNHVTTAQLGAVDAYQLLLLISAHTTRHTKQIEEIKMAPGFPK